MKNKAIILATILYFLIINTTYFWQGKLGLYSFPFFVILVLIFLILFVIFIKQVYNGINENFKNKLTNLNIIILIITLSFTFAKPNGLVNFEQFQEKDLLIAEREGGANCNTILKLKENGIFKEKTVCFGITEIIGKYEFKNDTIFFSKIKSESIENKYFEFAIIKKSINKNDNLSNIVRYLNKKDKIGKELWIRENNLIIQK